MSRPFILVGFHSLNGGLGGGSIGPRCCFAVTCVLGVVIEHVTLLHQYILLVCRFAFGAVRVLEYSTFKLCAGCCVWT